MSIAKGVTQDVQVDASLNDEQSSPSIAIAGFDATVDEARNRYQQARRLHWNQVARRLETWTGWGGYYHKRLTEVYQALISPGQSVLELGCARGDLLAAVKPSIGVGVDFSEEMIRAARRRHPHLRFVHGDAQTLKLSGKFDVIILSDLVNDVWDVQILLRNICQLATLAAASSSMLTAVYGNRF